jgi:hypothetical protein
MCSPKPGRARGGRRRGGDGAYGVVITPFHLTVKTPRARRAGGMPLESKSILTRPRARRRSRARSPRCNRRVARCASLAVGRDAVGARTEPPPEDAAPGRPGCGGRVRWSAVRNDAGAYLFWTPNARGRRGWIASPLNSLEAPPGFEPGIRVLQTHALPLGYGASRRLGALSAAGAAGGGRWRRPAPASTAKLR